MMTATRLGVLHTESLQQAEGEGAGSGPSLVSRPIDRPLRNDGIRRFWMARGNVYRLRHDGTGWVVTCQLWSRGHTYRLAEGLDAQLVDTLPVDDGMVTLDRAQTYEIREAGPLGPWEIHTH